LQDVSIYIATTAKGPAKRKEAYYIYVLECIRNGKAVTRVGRKRVEDISEHRLELMALISAFERLNKTCSVRVFTQCEHVLNSVNNHWVPQWEKNDWNNSQGKPVKNAELWQQLVNLTRQHLVTYTNEPHTYSMWQQEELEKMQKGE
jgi:ribonuclease HI